MCAVSGVGDKYSQQFWTWPGGIPNFPPAPSWPAPNFPPAPSWPAPNFPQGPSPDLKNPFFLPTPTNTPTQAEFAALKAVVEQMKKELEAAKEQDIAAGIPDCEMEDKVALLKAIASMVGVDLSKIFTK